MFMGCSDEAVRSWFATDVHGPRGGPRLIPKERIGGLYILGVEAIRHKSWSDLQWRMVPLEAGGL
jgi:hypothetical protein